MGFIYIANHRFSVADRYVAAVDAIHARCLPGGFTLTIEAASSDFAQCVCFRVHINAGVAVLYGYSREWDCLDQLVKQDPDFAKEVDDAVAHRCYVIRDVSLIG